jgi:hypothetical protein
LDGIDYRDELKDSPSQMEICFAIFVTDLQGSGFGTSLL